MSNIKENYEIMFTTYPDVVNIMQLKEMRGFDSSELRIKETVL